MDEDIISGCALNKTIPLRVVEPLHYTLFSIHIVSVFLLLFEFNLFSSRNRSPKTEKSRKIIPFAASDERGVRSQKLIKQHKYTLLASVLQLQYCHTEGTFCPFSPPWLMPLENLGDAGEEAGGLLGLWVALGFNGVAPFQSIDQICKLHFELQLQIVPIL